MDARSDTPPPDVAAEARPADAGKRSRGCFGCLASGSLGCGAFVFGAILAVALFAPQLLGGWAARGAETWLSQQVDGRVTVGGAELSWGEDTRLREVALFDDTNRELLRGSLRGPSLTEVFSEFEDGPPQFRARLQAAHLTIDAVRGLDLARALRWQQLAPLAALWRQGPEAAERPFLASIDAREVRIVDGRDAGTELELTGLLLDLERAVGARTTNFTLTCGVAEAPAGGAPRGSLDVSFQVGAQDQPLPSAVALRLKAEDLPARAALLLLEALRGGFDVGLPHALTPQGFSELAGACIDLDLSVLGDVQTGADVALSLSSERGEARLAGRIVGGVLRLGTASTEVHTRDAGSPAALEVRWQVPRELARLVLAPLVPRAWELTVTGTAGAAPTLRARGDALVLDTGFGRGWDADLALIELTADVPCDVALTLGLAPGADPSQRPPAASAPATIVARDPLVLVRWLGPRGGSVTAHWRSADPKLPESGPTQLGSATLRFEASLSGDGPGSAPAATVDVDLPGLPVALLRVAASVPAEGAALLGERVRIQVTGLRFGAGDAQTGALDFALYAGVGRVPVRGRVEGGVARAVGDGPQSLSFPGDRATLTRLLGPVLPWIDEFEAAGPAPVTVTFGDLAVPLDGGVLRPDGSLEFTPPPLRVRLAAPIARYFGAGDVRAWTTWHPRKFQVELNDELVRYESIELPLAGDLFPFKGSFDRATREVNLQGDVPMRLVQDPEWGGTELARQLVDSDVPVFVILSGPVDSPRLAIDYNQALGMLSRGFEQALEEVVPAMRGVLEQIVPRSSGEPVAPTEPRPVPPPDASGDG